MKYIDNEDVIKHLETNKNIETLLGFYKVENYDTIKWLTLEKGREKKDKYYLILHHVFDERDEIDNVYNFSYVEPDDLYGKILCVFDTPEELFQYASNFNEKNGKKWFIEGEMDTLLKM